MTMRLSLALGHGGIVAFCLLILGVTGTLLAQDNPMLHAVDGKVVDGKGHPILLRGFNLSPWLDPEPYLLNKSLAGLLHGPTEMKARLADLVGGDDAATFWRKWADAFVTENDFRHLAALGFNCVRLPINYRTIIVPGGQGILDESALEPVDHAVAWGQKYGIYVVLDLHHMPGGQNNLSTVADIPANDHVVRFWTGSYAVHNQALAVMIWRALAARYAAAPSVAGYDLINEPNLPKGTDREILADVYRRMIAAIRPVDPHHLIILEGDHFDHDITTLPIGLDGNVLAEFHEYAIFNRAWNVPGPAALSPFVQWRDANGVPLWLGEFGEETASWQGEMVRLMKAHDIGWSVWPWKRVDLGSGHPVLETIEPPPSWKKLADYLDGAMFSKRPTPDEARQAMAEMLQAIRTENCREDTTLAPILRGD